MIFLHLLDGSQKVIQPDQGLTVDCLLELENLVGARLVCQGSILNSNTELS